MNLKDQLSRKEKGKIKQYLLQIYKNDNIKKDAGYICSYENLLHLISLIEENKDFSKKDVENLKINLDSIFVFGLNEHVVKTSVVYQDTVFESAYKKVVEALKDNIENLKVGVFNE